MAVSGSAIKAGKAYVELYADESKLVRGLKVAGDRLKAFGSQVTAIGAKIAAAGAAITGPLLASTAAFVAAGDALEKMASRTGIAVEKLSALGYAAGQNGAGLEALGAGLRKMQQSLAEAGGGSDSAAKKFESLGLSVSSLMSMTPGEQFRAIADAVAGIEDPAKRTAAAISVFGDSGANLIPLLSQGAKGIREFEQRAKELGLVMSTQDAKAAAALGDAWDDLLSVGRAITNMIGGALAPTLTTIAKAAVDAAEGFAKFVDQNREAVLAVAAIGAGLLIGGTAIVGFGAAIAGIGAAIGGAVTVFTALVSPIGLAVAGIAALTVAAIAGTGAFLAFTETGQKMLATLQQIVAGFATAWSGIAAELSSGDLAGAAEIAMLQLGIMIQEGMLNVRKIVDEAARGIRKSITGAFEGLPGPLGKLAGKAGSVGNRPDPGIAMAERGINAAKGLLSSLVNKARIDATPLVESPFSQVSKAGKRSGLAAGGLGFDALKQKAAEEAAARFGGIDPRLKGLEGLGGVIGDLASRKSTTAGTFSAAAATRLGGRKGPEEETAKNTKKTVDLLSKLVNKKGVAFT